MSDGCMLWSVSVCPLKRTFISVWLYFEENIHFSMTVLWREHSFQYNCTLKLDLNWWKNAAESEDHCILTHCHSKHEFSIRPFYCRAGSLFLSGHRGSAGDNGYMTCKFSDNASVMCAAAPWWVHCTGKGICIFEIYACWQVKTVVYDLLALFGVFTFLWFKYHILFVRLNTQFIM